MLRVVIITRKNLYIALAILIAIVIGGILLMYFTKSDETFSETLKYAYNKITPQQANVLISQNTDLTILDIRNESEYLEGHIPNAILMPYKVMKDKYSSFDRHQKYLVYCEDGKKSEKLAKLLSKTGFSKVYVLIGGIENSGFELAK